jgi:Secretion system C-terminal sorting domain
MKKKLPILISLFIAIQGFAQKIVDFNFAQAIRQNCPTCLDATNTITEEGGKLRTLTVAIQNISDLTGVLGFSSLTSLNCTNNRISFIPPLPSSLKTLLISHNKLSEVANLPAFLTTLHCQNNQIKVLPDLPISLKIFDCSYNSITVLPQLPAQLQTLFCTHNLLSKLPVLPKLLGGLDCANNKLENLPVLPESLSFLACQNNNGLTCLPKLPDSLSYLYISKGISCIPNKVNKAVIEVFDGIVSQAILPPICSPVQLAFCPLIPPIVIDSEKKITISPNPTEGEITIKHQGIEIQKIWIFNYFGQLVQEYDTANIDFTNLAAGWYLIKMQTSNGIILEKIMKQ